MNTRQKRRKKQQLAEIFGLYCFWCQRKLLFEEATIDHLWPQSKGGSNQLENLRLTCHSCNHSRGNSLFPPKKTCR